MQRVLWTVCAPAPLVRRACTAKLLSVKQVLDKVEEDGAFYHRSGGGMTLSGGEAMMQHEFATAPLREARRHHINTTIETCTANSHEHLHEACKHLDKLIFDIKSLDPVLHKTYRRG